MTRSSLGTENAWQSDMCTPETVLRSDSGTWICMEWVTARSRHQRPERGNCQSYSNPHVQLMTLIKNRVWFIKLNLFYSCDYQWYEKSYQALESVDQLLIDKGDEVGAWQSLRSFHDTRQQWWRCCWGLQLSYHLIISTLHYLDYDKLITLIRRHKLLERLKLWQGCRSEWSLPFAACIVERLSASMSCSFWKSGSARRHRNRRRWRIETNCSTL